VLDFSKLAVGQRVIRLDTREGGTVEVVNYFVKIKWDSGRTSYHSPGSADRYALLDWPRSKAGLQ
jgi:hypothetical protein